MDFSGVVLPALDASVRPVYLDNTGELYCVVDLHDYEWAMKWKWKPIKSRGARVKVYAYRTTRFKGRHVSIWLHKEICQRAHGLPPSPNHIIGDHQDGHSLNNRRSNLEWATVSQNRINRDGIASQRLQMAVRMGDPKRVIGRVAAVA